MKKTFALILVAALVAIPSVKSLCFAEDNNMQGQGQGEPGMENGNFQQGPGPGQNGQDMPPMEEGGQQGGQRDGQYGGNFKKRMMMGMGGGMMGGHESMVATSDGGVVVMAGPKLMKYDRDLNLVKEVEMKKGKGPAPKNAPVPATNGAATGSSAPADSALPPALQDSSPLSNGGNGNAQQ